MMVNLTDNSEVIPIPPKIEKGVYRHYKGKRYEVLGIGTHTETLEFFVVYRPLYDKPGSEIWIRPYEMFVETVQLNDRIVPRFEKLQD